MFYYPLVVFFSQLINLSVNIGPLVVNVQRVLLTLYFSYAAYKTIIKSDRNNRFAWFARLHVSSKLLLYVLAFWLFYGFVALIWTKNVADGLRELLMLTFGIMIIFTMIMAVNNKKNLFAVYAGFKVSLILMIVLMSVEWLTGLHLFTSKFADAEMISKYNVVLPSYMPTGICYNENNQSFLMLLFSVFPLAKTMLNIKEAITRKNIKGFIFPLIWTLVMSVYIAAANSVISIVSFFGIIAVALILTFSVSRIVLGAGLIAFCRLAHPLIIQFISLIRRAAAPVFFALLVGVFGMNYAEVEGAGTYFEQFGISVGGIVDGEDPPFVSDYATRPHEDFSVSGLVDENYNSVNIRIALMSEGIRQTVDSYGLGVGPNGFKDNIKDLEATRQVVNPHFWFFEIMSQYGIIVLIGYVAALTVLAFSMFKDKGFKNFPGGFGALLFVIVFFPGSFGPSSMISFLSQWLFVGLAFSIYNTYFISEKSIEVEVPQNA